MEGHLLCSVRTETECWLLQLQLGAWVSDDLTFSQPWLYLQIFQKVSQAIDLSAANKVQLIGKFAIQNL